MENEAQLVMAKGPQPGATFTVDEPILVLGRDPRNAVVIDHPEVSRRHARVARRGETWVVEDLESTNGTFVNGRRVVEPHTLVPGDVIGLSEAVTLRFRQEEWPATVPSPGQEVRGPRPAPACPYAPQGPLREPPLADRVAPEAASPQRYPPSARARERKQGPDRTWLWIGAGCAVLLLIAACATALILGYLGLLPALF